MTALYVNADRTVFVRVWDDGSMQVATRPDPDAVWGPPITVTKEKTA